MILALALALNFIFSSEVEAIFEISFGIFGKVGEAKTRLIKYDNNSTYELFMDAKAIGAIDKLSGQRREYFYSTGEIYRDFLLPQKFVHKVERDKKGKRTLKYKIFNFNQRKKQIHFTKFKGDTNAGVSKSDDEILSYYAQNDLLTLFFNFSKIKPNNLNSFALIAAGANDKDGRVDIFIPDGKQKQKLQKSLNTQFQPYIAYINQDIFSSSKGELHLSINEKGYANRAILKDVLLFGDIVAKMVSVKEKP